MYNKLREDLTMENEMLELLRKVWNELDNSEKAECGSLGGSLTIVDFAYKKYSRLEEALDRMMYEYDLWIDEALDEDCIYSDEFFLNFEDFLDEICEEADELDERLDRFFIKINGEALLNETGNKIVFHKFNQANDYIKNNLLDKYKDDEIKVCHLFYED